MNTLIKRISKVEVIARLKAGDVGAHRKLTIYQGVCALKIDQGD